MPFSFSDLVIEKILREGLTALRRNPELIDDIFARLITLFPVKYGKAELNRIKKFITQKEIFVVHSFSQVIDSLPCISIQLMDDTEAKQYARVGDFDENLILPLDDEELEAFVKVDPAIPLAYDPITGVVSMDDSADLSSVNLGYIFTDAQGNESTILGGLNNLSGKKQFMVEPNSTVSLIGPGSIKSSISIKQFEVKGVTHNERIMLGIHTEERLLTLYIYTMVKYILMARKCDLINNNFKLVTLSGSDFARNMEYGEPVFSRWLNITGIATSSWQAEQVEVIDNIDVTVLVDKDIATTEDLELEEQTIQIADDE